MIRSQLTTGRDAGQLGGGCWARSSPSMRALMPAVNRWLRLSSQMCSPRAARVGKRSAGSDRKNSWSRCLVAASRTRCSLTDRRGCGPRIRGGSRGGGRRGGRGGGGGVPRWGGGGGRGRRPRGGVGRGGG